MNRLVFGLIFVLFVAGVLIVFVSATAPILSFVTPTNNSRTGLNYVFVNATSNNNSIINNSVSNATMIEWINQSGAGFNVSITQGLQVLNNTNFNNTFFNFTNLLSGVHTFRALINSSDDNLTYSTGFVNVTVDLMAPVLTVQSPANVTYNRTTPDLFINITAGDAHTSLDTCWATNNQIGGKWNLTSCNNLSSFEVAEGFNSIWIYTNDTVNNTNRTNINFTFDLMPTLILVNNTLPAVINISNTSQVTVLRVNVTVTGDNATATNVTFFMPYGVVNNTVCNGGTGYRRVNASSVSCERSYEKINTTTGTFIAELNITANLSAFTSYGENVFTFAANCTTSSACSQNRSLALMRVASLPRNPRPDAVNASASNASLIFINWNQTDSTYRVMMPLYTWSQSLGKPVLANNSFGDILYFDRSFFEYPTFMRMYTYNLTFRMIFDGSINSTASFIIRSPINNSAMPEQTFMPILVSTMEQTNMMSNNTYNMTMGIPSQSGFTVYWNGTNYTDTNLLISRGINVTYNFGAGGVDQSISLLTVTVDSINAIAVNNTDISILLTLMNLTAGSASSPFFVKLQQLGGWSFDNPPAFGQTLNQSYIINITNILANYTLNDLRLSFMQPMNVTVNESGTMKQFNMTYNVNISLWNGTQFVQDLGVIKTNSNVSFIEQMGPERGANITLFITTYEVLVSNSSPAVLNGWTGGTNPFAYVNFSSTMSFPVMDETAPITSSSANTTYEYNATINVPQRAPLNLTTKLSGLNSSSTINNITIDGVQVASTNYTQGSLVLHDVQSGQHVIAVNYRTAAGTTTSTGGTTPGGGTGTTIIKKIYSFAKVTSGTASIMKIDDSDIGMKQISIDVYNDATNVKITVEKLSGKPASITKDIEKAYQYINITTENLVSTNIKSAKIRFNVTKSWLSTNSFDSADVALKRWASSDWQKLETTKIGESITNVEYESVTPGFSTFVITAEKPPVVTPTPVCGNDILEAGEQCDKSKMAGATCVSRGFAGSGDLTCTSACTFNTTACIGAQGLYCGDGICNNNETSTTCLEDCPLPTGSFGLSTEQLAIIAIVVILIIVGGAWYWFFRR